MATDYIIRRGRLREIAIGGWCCRLQRRDLSPECCRTALICTALDIYVYNVVIHVSISAKLFRMSGKINYKYHNTYNMHLRISILFYSPSSRNRSLQDAKSWKKPNPTRFKYSAEMSKSVMMRQFS